MATLPIDLLAAIDAACDRFELAWASAPEGEAGPRCEELAATLPEAARAEGLRELFAIERQYRAARAPSAGDWASARPAIASLAASARDGAETLPGPSAPAPGSGAGLRLRCPRCDGAVTLAADAQLDGVSCSSCGGVFDLTRPEVDSPPLRVARFLLRERLGVGGFGAVWRARDPELDRDVALKTPRRGDLTPYEAELFFREARAAAQLAHPGVVSVFEVGRDDGPDGSGSIYLVSELVDGEPLSAHINEHRVTPRVAAALVADIAEALDYAHSRGVIHRDLKPSNVMLDRFATGGETLRVAPKLGRPRLMDFGLAKRDRGEVTMTLEGQVLGTPSYMSPEQASGRVRWVDCRTDIYSLGVVLFRLLTGELPFRGTAASQIEQRQTDDAPNARRLNDNAPLDLATVCAKCLERDPGLRYPSAAEVAAEMRRYLSGEPVHARTLSVWGRGGRWARRRPASAAALGLAAALAVLGPSAAAVIAAKNAALRSQVEEYHRLIERQERRVDSLRAGSAPKVGDTIPSWKRQAIERLIAGHGTALRVAAADDPQARAALARLYLAIDLAEEASPLLAGRDASHARDGAFAAAVAELARAASAEAQAPGDTASRLERLATAADAINAPLRGRTLTADDVTAAAHALLSDEGAAESRPIASGLPAGPRGQVAEEGQFEAVR